MNKKQLEKVKQILSEWNPIGEQSSRIADLNNYETEAVDILFYIDKKSSVDQINKITAGILEEAFGVNIDLKESKKFAERIKNTIIE